MWRATFDTESKSQVINGVSHQGEIAEAFRQVFQSHARPNNMTTNSHLQQQFCALYGSYIGDVLKADSAITVELVDHAVSELKRARAAGPDGITAEHLLYSHPLIRVLLSLLFRLMVMYAYVPDDFGVGMIIPLLKGDDCDSTMADNYRAITISPCISKVFEKCLILVFHPWLNSDDLQLGFKKGKGCRDAILTLRGIIKHINDSGSTAVLCALDLSKAFDKMNHYGLYIKLMERNIPRCFLDVLVCWYSKCFAFVRWNSFVSQQFQILAGVRQGGVLSPTLFAIFVDSVIKKLRKSGYGTYIGKFYFGCLLYADDIMLVSHSITVMQQMLDICSAEAESLDFSFNTVKSVALRIGQRYKHDCIALRLSGADLAYVDRTKYLGVMLTSSRMFTCSFDHLKLKFYRCFNAIFTRARNAGNELVSVHLLKSVCLPIILYGTEALQPSRSTLRMLDNLINRAVYRIFECSQSVDIKYIRLMVDLPALDLLVQRRHCAFVRQFNSCIPWADAILHAFDI